MNIEKIKSEGFGFQNRKGTISDFAYISLEIAIRSYASTYNSVSREENDFTKIIDDTFLDTQYSHNYIKNYSQTIIHLHHFFELIIKDALRNEHTLLATDAQDNPVILFELLKNKKNEATNDFNQKSIEFSKALKRICALIDSGHLSKYFFISEHKEFLESLNYIRNRILHRGSFILRYKALDWLFIKYTIPLVNTILLTKYFLKKQIGFNWKSQPISCGIDGFTELSKCINGKDYNIKRAAVIKEMIRAAYENPLKIPYSCFDINTIIHEPIAYTGIKRGFKFDNEKPIEQALSLAKDKFDKSEDYDFENMVYRITKCPVCGIESMLIYEDFINMNKESVEKYNCKVKCTCCSFEINSELDNLQEMNLNIDNFWERDLAS